MTLPLASLIISITSLFYVLWTGRQTRQIVQALEQQRRMGMDAWLAEQVSRWVKGELPSHTEQGVGVSGTNAEIIEPLPGWRIWVGTIEHGKRVPFKPTTK